MQLGVSCNSEFGQIFEPVCISSKILINFFLGLRKLTIVLSFSTLKISSLVLFDLSSCRVDNSSKIGNELLVITEILL